MLFSYLTGKYAGQIYQHTLDATKRCDISEIMQDSQIGMFN